MRVRQSELRRARHRKKEAYKLRLKTEGIAVKAAPKAAVAEKPAPKPRAAAKPKAEKTVVETVAAESAKPKAPRKKKVEEAPAEESATE